MSPPSPRASPASRPGARAPAPSPEPPRGCTTSCAAPRGGLGRRWIEGRQLWVAGALLLVAVCAALRALDLDGLWLGLLQFVPTIALLLALAAAGDAAVTGYVAGGEAAPAVAVAL